VSRIYIVLGTGRSATSYITQCIHNSGSTMYKGVNKHAEDWDFKKLNQDILEAAGGDAYHPPTTEAILGVKNQFNGRIKKLIADRCSEYQQWGFKDPRTVFTLPLYKPFLKNHDVYYIYCLRPLNKTKESFKRLAWTDHFGFLQKHKKRLKEIIDEL
jgi:hypothetical protein